jgi:hypothetical protein
MLMLSFDAQVLYVWRFWSFEGAGGLMYVDV